MSYNRWAYGYDNPVIYSDPSGKFPIYCGSLKTKEQYEMCVLAYYGYEKSDSPTRLDNISGTSGCYHGPIEYRAEGYLEGTGAYLSQIYSGNERVYDFATMKALNFSFVGTSLVFDNLGLTAGVQAYIGNVKGLRSIGSLKWEYSGPTVSIFGGGSLAIPIPTNPGLGISVSYYQSTVDRTIRGTTVNVGVSASILDILPMLDGGYSLVQYEAITNEATRGNYVTPDGRKIQKGKLILDIGFGYNSPIKPWHYGIILINSTISMGRSYGITKALKFAADFEDIHAQE